MFSPKDACNIALQRTSHLKSNLAFRLWTKGWSYPLQLESRLRRAAIVNGALSDAEMEFGESAVWLRSRQINRMVDIGCGHALIDLFFWRRYGCHLHVVDIEETPEHHHDFHKQ